MRFQTKIIGMPVYLLADRQPTPEMSTYTKLTNFPQLSPNGGVVFDNYKIWLTIKANIITANAPENILDVSSFDKDSALFTVQLLNSSKNTNHTIHEAQITIADKYLKLDEFGLVLTSKPATVKLISTCSSITDGGLFTFMNDAELFALVTKDTSQRPILGITDKPQKASSFYFSWKSSAVSKDLIRAFLKARYYIDNPTLLSRRDQIDDIKKVYEDLGNVIIGNLLGDRIENIFYDNETINRPFNGNKDLYHGQLDGSTLSDYRAAPYDPSTVEYQRSIMDEESSAAVDMYFESSMYEGIYKNAIYKLERAGVQPAAWEQIDKIVDPIGKETNVWCAPLILNKNKLGLNFHHPVIQNLRFIKRAEDGELNMGRGMAVYVVELDTSPLNSKPLHEDMTCICGGNPETPPTHINFNMIIIIFLIILVCLCAKSINDEKKKSNIFTATT